MAKVSGPLFSVDASGGYADSLVFTKSKGKNYARRLVTSTNKHTAEQEASRNYTRITAACQKWANANTQVHEDLVMPDKAEIIAITPPGKTWNIFLSDNIIGIEKEAILEANFEWNELRFGDQPPWEAAAIALNTPFKSVKQTVAGGALGVAKTPGYMFFVYSYGLYWMGLTFRYTGTPPVYT